MNVNLPHRQSKRIRHQQKVMAERLEWLKENAPKHTKAECAAILGCSSSTVTKHCWTLGVAWKDKGRWGGGRVRERAVPKVAERDLAMDLAKVPLTRSAIREAL